MLQQILQIRHKIDHMDASDALAVAICHHFQASGPALKEKKINGWESFVRENPGRVKGI
jgi:crossover junction endodeoxyribonuclease RuvC